ncbi:aminoacyltransferase [Streptococcus anginosus]|uniref:aminoacyltransferase n=1 Tax=Streptococcus anginosus TaxID=1328 RepID=UPI003081FF27|nr:aminoacyltransferase [Streptococcus anginosus]
MTFKRLSQEEFVNHSASCAQRSFMQTVEMEMLLAKRGFTCQYVGHTNEHDEVTVSAVLYSMPMTGGLHMEINCGPVSTNPHDLQAFYRELKTYAKENGALELIVKPYETYQTFDSNGQPTSPEKTELIKDLTDLGYEFDGFQTGYPGGEPVWHYLKTIKGDDSKSLLKSFNKNCSRNITTALNYDISIRNITREEIPQFKQIIEETGKRQGFEDKSLSYYYDLYDSFGPNAEFVVAEINSTAALAHLDQKISLLNPSAKQYEQQLQKLEKQKNIVQETLASKESETVPLACALIIYTPSEVTYLFGGSYTKYQKFSAAFLIQYHAMKRALQKGITLYNFLGITGEFDGSDGVLRFKQNFNGYIVRKMGTFRYYPQPLKFKVLNMIKKMLRR